ncbi:MAG: DUF664 domain-containing protein [Acidimicrobiia bacterium]|nr:DUF664 domain-containing protein [Acidimicrobiia bacterium]
MSIEALQKVDFSPWDEPESTAEPRSFLESFYRYQRHEFLRKLRDLDSAQLVEWSIAPVQLSVLGLVRHMTQMEHAAMSWGLGGGERVMAYGEDDYAGGSVETVEADIHAYFAEVAKADAAIASLQSLESVGKGHGRTLRTTLVKMIDEYALHAGQAHMLRFAALGAVIR